MDQRHKVKLYVSMVKKINDESPHLLALRQSNFEEYEIQMSEKLPRFKEDYRTLFKLAIREFDQPSFLSKLDHFLNITQNVLNGKRTLDDATKQVADEQYKEYVAPIVENKEKQ